ncbi:MAG: serine/threonine-protein kinase [Ramlibacter sp.]
MPLPEPARWKILSPLLDELLDLTPQCQQGRLQEICISSPDLASELDALLRGAHQAEASLFMGSDPGANEAARASLPGRKIGAYVIEDLLGEGASGTVWRARRVDGRFDACVAIKLLHLSLLGRPGAHRFQREGAILGRVTHPDIARLLDAGVTEQGQPYLVLELVDGDRIDRHCDDRHLNVRERVGVFMRVLAAVSHAHGQQVVHRDIKPNNVYVLPDGKVKLLDFGIAKLMHHEATDAPITAEGLRVLTPQYAAPEQLNGGPVTAATDIYALGILLYQLLTDRHPTAGESATSVQVMRATLENDPLPLGTALAAGRSPPQTQQMTASARSTALVQLRRQLRGDLENIVARALQKDPARRYQSAAALAEDLRRYLANEPVAARRTSLVRRCWTLIRRRRALASTVVLMLSIAAGVSATAAQRAHAARLQLELEDARATLDRNMGGAAMQDGQGCHRRP